MMPHVQMFLMSHIGILAYRRSIQESKPQRMVVRFIPSVFAVVHHRNAVTAIRRRNVGPLLGYHLILVICIAAASDITYAKVVCSYFIRHIHWELGFKEGIPFVPVYLVTNIYPVILSSFRKSYILYEVGSAVSTFHFE